MSVTVAKTALVARDCKSNACKSAAGGNINTKVTKAFVYIKKENAFTKTNNVYTKKK